MKERCQYTDGNLQAEARVEFLKEVFDSIGLGKSRLEMYFMSSAMSDVFVNKVKEFTEAVRKLGKLSSSLGVSVDKKADKSLKQSNF